MNLYKEIVKEYQWLKEELNRIKNVNKNEETILCCKNQNRYKWYMIKNGKRTYIPKTNRKLAERLAVNKYYTNLVNDLTCEINACKSYLNKMKKYNNSAEQLLEHPEYARLLQNHFVSRNSELEAWQKASYEKNEKYKEQLNIIATEGKFVRSKSEAIIDKLLYTFKVPFRYEEKLVLGNNVIYPDFTIRHPKTGRYYYWEHFGMMDDKMYIKNACDKIKLYAENGIIPNVNLIMTFETVEHPLNINDVEKIIEEYFID